MKEQDEAGRIDRLAFCAFLINLCLAAMKIVLSWLSGSLAVTAGAVDSVTDSVASSILYGGLKISAKKTPNFPLGLYKIENVISVVVGFLIFFTGYEIARHVFTPVETPLDISFTVVLLLSVGTLVTFVFGQYMMAVGRRTGSPTLIAEGRHRQADVWSSVIVLMSVLMSYFHIRFEVYGISIDHIAAAAILVFIALSGWQLISDGMRVLLDASVDFETLQTVRGIVGREPAVSETRSLVGRNAGRFRFIQMELVLRVDDLQKAHKISERIQRNVRSEVPNVERVLILYEPSRKMISTIAVPLMDKDGRISSHFGESPYFALVVQRKDDGRIESQEILSNPHLEVQKAKGIQVAEWLIEKKIDEMIVREEMKHKGPGYVFSNAGIRIHVLPVATLDEAMERLFPEKGSHIG